MSPSSFNPRPREGGDPAFAAHTVQNVPVSIHAPVKGATVENDGSGLGISVSIHAPVKGATRIRYYLTQHDIRFNPRPREGGDLGTPAKPFWREEFQSTPP